MPERDFEKSLAEAERLSAEFGPRFRDGLPSAYETLLESAEHVGGMPFETPIRWQEVGHFSGPIHSRYTMVKFPDRRLLTVEQKFLDPRTDWTIRLYLPMVRTDASVAEKLEILVGDDTHGSAHLFNEDNYSQGYRRLEQSDFELVDAVVEEAVSTAPERQARFMVEHPEFTSRDLPGWLGDQATAKHRLSR